MKIFEILDKENNLSQGVLLYYAKSRTFVIELQDSLDEWTAPLLLTSFVKKGIFTIPRKISALWVRERIIPSGRQNIDAILKTHKLREYDEMKFLELSGGRCSQDSLYIKKIFDLPKYVTDRMRRNLSDCVPCEDHRLLCFFSDGTIGMADLNELSVRAEENVGVAVTEIEKLLRNDALYRSGKITAGGYSVTFNDSIDIPAYALYGAGVMIPLRPDDFLSFLKINVLDTTQTCGILECSRQNLAYMVGQKQLAPVKEDVRGSLYLKGDVLRAYLD